MEEKCLRREGTAEWEGTYFFVVSFQNAVLVNSPILHTAALTNTYLVMMK